MKRFKIIVGIIEFFSFISVFPVLLIGQLFCDISITKTTIGNRKEKTIFIHFTSLKN